MATALQCPECGFKHRLDAVGDRTVFACARCSRPLKVPTEYRPAAPRNGTDRGRDVAVNGARAPSRRAPAAGSAPLKRPVRVLFWVIAFVLAAVVVRYLAKITGFVGGDTFVNLLIDHSIGTYFRLFLLVPVWALFATLFATAFIDGPGWWRRRQSGSAPAPTRRPRGAEQPDSRPAGAAGAAVGNVTETKTVGRPKADDAPREIPRRDAGATVGAAAPARERTRPVPVPDRPEPAAEPDFEERAAAGQRPRRIPRRGADS